MPVNSVPILPPPPGGGGGGGGGGVLAFTTAPFVQPAVNSEVTIEVNDSSPFVVGETVFIPGAGFMLVTAIVDPTHITVANLGAPGNTAPGTVVPANTPIMDGDFSFGQQSVPNEAAMTALQTEGLPEGYIIFVQTYGAHCKLETTTAALTAGEVFASDNPAKRWLRLLNIGNLKWTKQVAWSIDSSASIENTGLVGSPVPLAEAARRLVLVDPVRYNFNYVAGANALSTDTARFQPTVTSTLPNASNTFQTADFRFNSVRTITPGTVASTVTLATNSSATTGGTGEFALLTDTSAAGIAQLVPANIGKLVVITSLGSAVRAYIVDAGGALPAGTARVTQWFDSNALAVTTAPAPGNTYQIQDTLTWSTPVHMDGLPNQIDMQWFSWEFINAGPGRNGITLGDGSARFWFSKFTGTNDSTDPNDGMVTADINGRDPTIDYGGCLFFPPPNTGGSPGATTRLALVEGRIEFNGCGFINISVTFQGHPGVRGRFSDCEFLRSILRTGVSLVAAPGDLSTAAAFGYVQFGGIFGGVGFLNWPATFSAVTIQKQGALLVQAGLYGLGGAGTLYGLEVKTGGTAMILNGVNPVTHLTITGAAGQIRLDELATAIPGLTGGLVVPAASALATWANWNAAPFSRFVVSYQTPTPTGAKIISVPVA